MREYIIKFENDVPISELASGTTIRALINITDDRDEIIRCKDCKYLPGAPRLYADDDPVESYIHCGHLGEDGFCSLAERKEE